MDVRDWMSPDPVTVSPETPVAEARQLFTDKGFRHLPVVAGGVLCGIVSDRDVVINPRALRLAIRRRNAAELVDDDRPVEAVMSSTPHTVAPDAPVSEASRLLVSRQVGALPVVDEDRRLVGIITVVDCLLSTLSPQTRSVGSAELN